MERLVGRAPAPVHLWAVVVVGTHSRWIHPYAISKTRKAAWTEYLSLWDLPDAAKADLKAGRLNLERVTVSVTPNAKSKSP
ncbi:MAG: hypothetical protein WC710_13495 [Gallionella sp.]|jgi:hypothetical protein